MKLIEELELARRAARKAGAHLAGLKLEERVVLSREGRDIKLRADRDAEKIILALLKEESDHPVLTEERGEIGTPGEGLFWVIDPLDGTMNFNRGIPMCCVSVALVEEEQPRLGVIYDFNRDELYHAVEGGGAFVNEQPIAVADTRETGQAVLSTGFPSYRDMSDASMQQFVGLVQSFKKVRMIGSAAMSLAYVACGRVDAYGEDDIMLWDIAAGLVLVAEAGGVIELRKSERHKWGRHVRTAARAGLWPTEDEA